MENVNSHDVPVEAETPYPCFVPYRETKESKVTLYCVPYAGAGPRVYNSWYEQLPEYVDLIGICLPGREHRLLQSPHQQINSVTQELSEAIMSKGEHEFILFGHSLGGLIAYDLACYLTREGFSPAHLIASGTLPPHVRRKAAQPFYAMDTDDMLEGIANYIGLPNGIGSNKRVLKIFSKIIRADLNIEANYEHTWEDRLACGLTVFSGMHDPDAKPEMMELWQELCQGEFAHYCFDGGHLFIDEQFENCMSTVSFVALKVLDRINQS